MLTLQTYVHIPVSSLWCQSHARVFDVCLGMCGCNAAGSDVFVWEGAGQATKVMQFRTGADGGHYVNKQACHSP